MKIVMIRHGLSEANIKRVLSGASETPLSKKGAEELHKLKLTYTYPKTDLYITSPLTRCIDTFDILYSDEAIKRTDERFKEISFGDAEGLPFKDVSLDDFFPKFFKNENVFNNEIYDDFIYRIEDGLKAVILELEENDLSSATIVAHSTVIKVLVKKANNVKDEDYKNIPMRNGEGYIFDIDLVDDKIVYNSVKELDLRGKE